MANPGPARPVLRGAASGRRLIIIGQAATGTVTVSNLVLENGHFNNSPVGAFGGTLVIATCGQTATLARCVFTGNNSMGGGGGEPPDLRQPVSVLGDFPGCVSF
jgi:hypothetical protein